MAKLNSLKRAISVHLAEGPTPSNSFRIFGGEPGCESETLAYVGGNSTKIHPSYKDLLSSKFKVQFDTVLDIGKLIGKKQAFDVVYKGKKWFSLRPGSERIQASAGCLLSYTNSLSNPVCVNGVLFSYQENGFLVMNKQDFDINSKNRGVKCFFGRNS